MVVQVNEHVDVILNSIRGVKSVFLPLDASIRKVAKDFEQSWPGYRNRIGSHGNIVDHGTELDFMQLDAGSCSSGNGYVSIDERTRGIPGKMLVSMFQEKNRGHGHRSNDGSRRNDHTVEKLRRKGLKAKYGSGKEDGSSSNCLQFGVVLSLLINGFVKALPFPLNGGRKRVVQKASSANDLSSKARTFDFTWKGIKGEAIQRLSDDGIKFKEGNDLSFEYMLAFFIDPVSHLKLDVNAEENLCNNSFVSPTANAFDHFKVLTNILEGESANVHGFLRNLRFARVGGVPVGIIGDTSIKESNDDGVNTNIVKESERISPLKFSSGLLSIPFSNVERLRSSLSTVSLTELIELLPQLGRPSKDHPDKKKLFSVQDFFKYAETEGRRFFEELDRDGDGEVTLEDLEAVMRKRKLPRRYAREFMHRARRHLFSKSFGWKQFLSLMEQKEATILRAYTSLCLSKSGTLQKSEILASLDSAGLPANEDNAVAMMRFLNADSEESVSYGHFRNFMLLLPSDRLQEDPRSIWFEAATVVAVAPPVEIPTGSFLKSALAGGLACALSTALMHPVDTIKTQVQASTLTFPEIISKVPQLGARGLYRGSIPAILGQFSSHGLRTGIFEASKVVLINIAPTLQELQVQSLASFGGTFFGTAVRIPCEVLKQRLQAGLFTNVGDAVIGTWKQDGMRGFFRGTGATLFREVPFYVAGMGLYAESKKVVQQLLGRELEPWETISVGALSGGLTAVLTTPFDVIKTRMMTAPKGRTLSLTFVAISILRREGPLGLFKGALPRFFWIAPLGAMNFAGYELAKKAMEKNEENVVKAPKKKLAST